MKKINVFLPILLISGILNNSSIYAGSSCSRMMQVERINIPRENSQRENSQTRPFDSISNETRDFRNLEDFKILIKQSRQSETYRTSVLYAISCQVNKINSSNIDYMDIYDAINYNDLKGIYNNQNQINNTDSGLLLQTPLHYAIQNNKSSEVILLLLLLGANINTQDFNNNTPLDLTKKLKSSFETEQQHNKTIAALSFCAAQQ